MILYDCTVFINTVHLIFPMLGSKKKSQQREILSLNAAVSGLGGRLTRCGISATEFGGDRIKFGPWCKRSGL